MVEGGEGAYHTAHYCHWVGIATKAVEESAYLLVDHSVQPYGA